MWGIVTVKTQLAFFSCASYYSNVIETLTVDHRFETISGKVFALMNCRLLGTVAIRCMSKVWIGFQPGKEYTKYLESTLLSKIIPLKKKR